MSTAKPELTTHHRAERLSHAIYGLVLVTAALAAEQHHVEDVRDAFGLLLGTALVLLLVHVYTAAMAARVVEGGPLGNVGRRLVVADNLPVLITIIVPAVLFTLAAFDAITLNRAYTLSIAFGIIALFALGIYEGRVASMTWVRTILSGAAAASIGVVVIAVEVFFE